MDSDQEWCIVRGRKTQSGAPLYVVPNTQKSDGMDVGPHGPPLLIDAHSETKVSKAIAMLKTLAVEHIEVVFLATVGKPYDDDRRRLMMQRIGLSNLSISEIDALDLNDKMIFHRLAKS